MGDWDGVAEGIILTNKAIYVNSPKNKDKQFSVKYNEITRLAYYRNPAILRIEAEDKTYTITTELWSKRCLYNFLQFTTYPVNDAMRNCGQIKFDSGDGATVSLFFVDVSHIEESLEELLMILIHEGAVNSGEF